MDTRPGVAAARARAEQGTRIGGMEDDRARLLPIPNLVSPSITAHVPKVAHLLVTPVLFTSDEVNQ